MPAVLYHAPIACSLAVRIAAAEGDVPLDLKLVNLNQKTLVDGGSYLDISPLGQVSVMITEDGETLTETATCIAWVQARSRNADFRRAPDAPDYFQMLRWLGFCATELHKQIFRIVFYPEADDGTKDRIRGLAPARFAMLDTHLADRDYLLGDRFSAADAYLTWFFVLADRAALDFSAYPRLSDYAERCLTRPKIAPLIESDIAARAAMA